MALAALKFCIPTPKILVVGAAIFIFLSEVSPVPTVNRRCYWCGPLADQVHRSIRAPSCEESQQQVTTCERGFTHCAIIAITPSKSEEIRNILHIHSNTAYIESRLCVKFYEEECYSIYCNASQMHSMICPCLNDLCNGPNTQREKKAFATLVELAKDRKKRELITSPTFKRMENITTMQFTDNNNDSADNLQADEPVIDNLENNDKNESNAMTLLKDDVNTSTETNKEIADNEHQTIPQITTEDVKVTEEIETVTHNPVKLTSIKYDEPSVVQSNVPPSARLPPAEALQQNVTPTDKTTEPTTVNTDETLTVTLEPNETNKRNNTARFYFSIYMLIICIAMQYYL